MTRPIALSLVLVAGCYSGLPDPSGFASPDVPDQEPDEPAPANSLLLEVVDPRGAPIASADVELGERRLVTDGAGRLLLLDLLDTDLVARVGAPGRAPAVLRVHLGAQADHVQRGARVVLADRVASATIVADDGGDVIADGLRLVIPPGSFVDERGALIDGDVTIHLALGGRLPVVALALDDPHAPLTAVWDALEIHATWNDEPVALAPGAALQLSLPAPAGVTAPQAYSLDPAALQWTRRAPAGADPQDPARWTFAVDHLGWWGLGAAPGGDRTITLELRDLVDDPLPHAPMVAVGARGEVLGVAYSDAVGRATLRVPAADSWSIVPGLPGAPQGDAVPLTGDAVVVPATILTSERCVPGDVRTCGATDAPTIAAVGLCAPARDYCGGLGLWLGCAGQVLPAAETCQDLRDEDCDGLLNESGTDCACDPGALEPCYTGPGGTRDVGACIGGERTCLDSGRRWSGCEGERLPAIVEACATDDEAARDDTCDGTPACGEVDRTWRFDQLTRVTSVVGTEEVFYLAGAAAGSDALTVLRQVGAGGPAWSATLEVADDWTSAYLAPRAADEGVLVGVSSTSGSVSDSRLVEIDRHGSVRELMQLPQVTLHALTLDLQGRAVVSGTFTGSLDGLPCASRCGFAGRIGEAGWEVRHVFPDVAPETAVRLTLTPAGAIVVGATSQADQLQIWRCTDDSPCNAHVHGEMERRLHGLVALDESSVAVLFTDLAVDQRVLAVSDTDTDTWRWSTVLPLDFVSPWDSAPLAVDAAGEITVGGYTQSSVDTPAGPLIGGGGHDAVVRKWNRDGDVLWTFLFAAPDNQHIGALTVEPDGDLLLAGDAHASVDFGDGADDGATFMTLRRR